MTLDSGTQLGSYEVLELVGAGGMGQVYRTRDHTLGRDVAIKVLPEAFAGDRERLARFENEARVLASLNHPNIAAIYGLEESNDDRGELQWARKSGCGQTGFRSVGWSVALSAMQS